MLTLYFAPGSSSFAVHIALHEVGAQFEGRPMSFAKKDMQSPAYLAINPEGKVPTLVIEGRPLTEVAGILYYLARKFPEAGLLPVNDPENEARAISWMSFIASTLHPARRLGAEHTKKVYGIADARLGDKDWVLGRYSIADIHLFRLYWRFTKALDFASDAFPHLAAHHARMMARPAVKKTIAAESAVGYELPDWFPRKTPAA
ncbi:MAG TPA: glutathione S-transferase family protein [Micropepsaceae bacterium]|jgi:glutathione S-transferase|nr:glutathione S-transferase family protein [Micropepsaceae bacterium]